MGGVGSGEGLGVGGSQPCGFCTWVGLLIGGARYPLGVLSGHPDDGAEPGSEG